MRKAGVLVPIFSLPGDYGVGDFGPCCYRFIDFLEAAGMKIWQVLPLNPTGYGHSPYQPFSSFAGNSTFVDLHGLYEDGLLKEEPKPFEEVTSRVDYDEAWNYKLPYFKEALSNFKPDKDYEEFVSQPWVRLYAVFKCFKDMYGDLKWNEWPEEHKNWIKTREPLPELEEEILLKMFLQYEFNKQWMKVKKYANERGIVIMGDIPFYVGLDSLDVWMNQDEFDLDPMGHPLSVAGVPPDYFSAEGQRWGNPIYNWDHMKENHFKFWRERVKYQSHLFTMIRIDHFRAFDTYWKIPETSPTAIVGEWLEAPGYEFFDLLLPELPKKSEIIAEDLGFMREEVYELRDHYEFPGMDVIQFTLFDEGFKEKENMIIYTGTHDNDMIRSWYESLSECDQERAQEFLKEANCEDESISDAFIKMAMYAKPKYAIIPVQDILGYGTEARINVPGIVAEENWCWKLTSLEPLMERADFLKKLVEDSKRA